MEEAEKMAALKKVYADIILNMAKESAARVLSSERRALGFQHGLSAAKEETLATLLRLKSIMDSKIREAETASMGQVRRIQELEDQLNEAEDIICSLRSELRRVNNEMEKMKNNIAEQLSGKDANSHITSSLEECHKSKTSCDHVQFSPVGSGHLSPFDTKSITLGQRTAKGLHCSVENATQSEPLKDFSAENDCGSNPDLASIIMRRKEPELYRNRCTQRIRAFEQNLVTAKVPLGKSDDHELIVCESTKAIRPCTIDSAMADETILQVKNTAESKEIVQHASSCGNGQVVKCSRSVSSRIQSGKLKRIKPINCCVFPDQDTADSEPTDTASRKRSEDGKLYTGKSFKNGSSGLLQCSKSTLTRRIVMKRSHSDSSENQVLESPPLNTENNQLLSTGVNGDGPVQNDACKQIQGEILKMATPDQRTADNSLTLLCEANPEEVDVLMTNSDSKVDKAGESGEPAQTGSSIFLKYTFQRKRKRGSLNSNNEKALLEKKSTLKRTGDKNNASPEPQNPSLPMEFPRKDRRLVQVARQLISLSERRW